MLGTGSKASTGGGNRSPLPPVEFGGGDGGGGRGDGDGLHSFGQQLQRYRLGLLFTVASIVMLFISFTTLFVARRGAGIYDTVSGSFESDWVPVPLPMQLLLLNTGVLAASSLLIELARRAAKMDAILVPVGRIPGVKMIRQNALPWVWATSLAGMVFVAGQFRAWRAMHLHGIGIASGPASTFFYLLTGAHALHFVAGLIILFYAWLGPGPRHSLERRSITLEVTALYWHFMTVMWVYVLVVLKVLN
jgi:cytochrome c oxidase subunit 3